MAKEFYGFRWQPHPAVQPAITEAVYILAPPPTIRIQLRPEQWVLDYAFEAAGLFRAGPRPGDWQPRRARTAHLYPPGTPYWEDGRQARRFHAGFILFNAGEAAGLTRFLNSPARFCEFYDPTGQLGQSMMTTARIGRDAGEDGFWQAQAGLFNILDCLHCSRPLHDEVWRINMPPSEAIPRTLADEVDRYLREHLAENITLATLARHLHLSVSSLAHRYQQETGNTPLTRLAHLRIAQARQLLLLGQSLKSIAPAIGFCDPFHLSKTFKRVTGLSPRTFLASFRADGAD
jgi:AraC-like DNA-binding protein